MLREDQDSFVNDHLRPLDPGPSSYPSSTSSTVTMDDDLGIMGLIPSLPVKRTASNAEADKKIWATHLPGWDGTVDINDLPIVSKETVVANHDNREFIHALGKIMTIKADIQKVETMLADQDDRTQREHTANLILIKDGDTDLQKAVKRSTNEILNYIAQNAQIPSAMFYAHLLALSSFQTNSGTFVESSSTGYMTPSSMESMSSEPTPEAKQDMPPPASTQIRSVSAGAIDNPSLRTGGGCTRSPFCDKANKHLGGCNQVLNPNPLSRQPRDRTGRKRTAAAMEGGLMRGGLNDRFTRSASTEARHQVDLAVKGGTGAQQRDI